MTIEEKAKAYNVAIERMKSWVRGEHLEYFTDAHKVAEFIFPELKESKAKDLFIKALERAVEQTRKGYELSDCDKCSWWEDFKAYSGIQITQKPIEWNERYVAGIFEQVGLAKIVRELADDRLTNALQAAMIKLALQ